MKLKSRLIIAASVIVLTCVGVRARCMVDTSPPCQAFWTAEVVFTGTATQVFYSATYQKGEGTEKWDYRDRIARFTVDETFRGSVGKQVDVIASEMMPTHFTLADGSSGSKFAGESDCEYKFNRGERYIVYAQFRTTNDGTLWVGHNRTRPLAQAYDDLGFIRNLKKAQAVGLVFGTAKRHEQDLKKSGNSILIAPVQNVRIVVEGAGQKREAFTDAEGHYSVGGLRPGQYDVMAVFPDHLASYPAQKARVVQRGCVEINFTTRTDGRISGTVFDAQGQPLPKMRLDLAPADQDQSDPNPQILSALADEDGHYEFRIIPAGRYHLGIRLNADRDADFPFPRAYYPGVSSPAEAEVFTLKEGQRIEKVDFVMPSPLEPRTIEGVVVGSDGRPMAGARVALMITNYPFSFARGGNGTTDDAGRFSIKALDGLSYWINAVVDLPQGPMHAEPVDLPPNGDVRDVKLEITSPSVDCEMCRHRYWPKRKT